MTDDAFHSFRRRSNITSSDADSNAEHISTTDWLRHPRASRRSSETPLQKVTRLIQASLETEDFTEVLNVSESESKLASQVIHELLEPSNDEASGVADPISVSTRNKLRVLSWRLGAKYGHLSESFFLHEVKCTDNESRFSWDFADIFCGEYKGQRVALKRVRYYTKLRDSQKNKLKQACYREAQLWKTLRHKHVLPFLGISADAFDHTPCVVLPWVKSGNILQFMDILKVRGNFSGPDLLTTTNQWLYEISQGIAYLHGEGIVHGDIRGINVLVDSGVAVVTNFDLATIPGTAPIDEASFLGPARWRCPELMEDQPENRAVTFASDVYSFACTAIELYTGHPPFSELHSESQVLLRVLAGHRPSRPSLFVGVVMSDHLWGLMTRCWSQDPAHRPSVLMVVQTLALACPQDELPSALFLKGVVCVERESMASGSFADIYEGEYEGNKVALKRLKLYQKAEEAKKLKAKRAFFRESLIWSTLKHQNILPFLGVDDTNFKQSLCMVLPWMEHGNIRDCIYELKTSDRFHDGVIRVTSWLSQIADGLTFLHSMSYVHGDLRAANILIDSDWNVRLADFGLAVVAEPTTGSFRTSSNGAIRWLAPELLSPEDFGFESSRPTYEGDVYAFGCVCLEIHTCRDPFQGLTDYQVIQRVVKGQRPDRPSKLVSPFPSPDPSASTASISSTAKMDPADTLLLMSDALWDLCHLCWRQDKSERPSAEQVLEKVGKEMERLGVGVGNWIA